ncbi:MAG: tetratricopeptide repeat protein, partial [Flavobacteriaceae bacterium]|nr:tetratricopeptide repeat protein [Flavobacteriaceae bacterium]
LRHSFEYDDAREAFLEAQKLDPKMAMAYWGEAMTYNHSLWNEQDYDDGKTALDKLNEFDYKDTTSELEQDFIEAAKILYKPETEKKARDKEYSQFMSGLNQKYPNNHEVAAFYALSLLGASEDGRDYELYGQGAKIAQGIIEENPNHPGALHYLIHSYDDPEHAHLALSAADAYAKVAPDASHALHMPSHIYVAKGMWDQVVSSNINSYQASLNRMERKNLDNDDRGYHAYHWLQYGYLQKGNVDEAKDMALEMEKFMKEKPSKRARAHMVFLKGTYLNETNDWDSEVADIDVKISDLNISIRSQYHFLEGMKAFKTEDIQKMDSIIELMEQDYNRESYIVENEGTQLCSAITREQATKSDLIEAKVRQAQLLGLKSDLEGRTEEAESFFKEAISLNESISYSFGPPHIQKPTHDLYADWLLSQGRTEEARIYYEESLKYAPKRTLALKGLEKTTQF